MTPKVCGAYIHTYVVKRGKSVIAIVAFTTALLVRALCDVQFFSSCNLALHIF